MWRGLSCLNAMRIFRPRSDAPPSLPVNYVKPVYTAGTRKATLKSP